MAASMNVPNKENLEETSMQVKGVWGMEKVSENTFTWRICRYQKLKKNVDYSNKSSNLGWLFTITRKNSCYDVSISTENYDGDIMCCVGYDDDVFSNSISSNSVNGGVYKVKIPNDVIYVQQNKFLQTERILLIFRFNAKDKMLTLSLRSKTTKDPSRDDTMKEYFKELKNSLFSADFVISVNGEFFVVHKAILAARSRYFRQYIHENCRDRKDSAIILDTTFEAMYAVVNFIYTGQLRLKSAKHASQIIPLIEKLGISNLAFFTKKTLQDNASEGK